jgi:site-specific DNA recombinase
MDRQNSPGWATYLRVSDEDKQSPERSFAMQRQRIQEQLLTSSEIPFKREYYDTLTGTNPNRKDYQQMLTDAVAGSFSHLGLYRADRFGRNAVEGLQAATKLISLGIKLRVANMPTLTPETPDGFFMFLLQMGLAQREVDVLRIRTADGMEAKLRAGGWTYKAPLGYVNKEKHVGSNKYERWVEQDPESITMIREAWDLLLSDHYTLAQICEELTGRGYTRSEGRPWAWDDPKSGLRKTAANSIFHVFHNPFYAGWVVSKRFGIQIGEVRGNWESITSTDEFERGLYILRKHDQEKSRKRRHFYLLRNVLWVEFQGKPYRMYGSSPKPRTRWYPYYVTNAKPNGKNIHIPCEQVDSQIPEWLSRIAIETSLIPEIRIVYQSQVTQATRDDQEKKIQNLRSKISELRNEEARLGRLYISGKISEESYDQLHAEWKERIRNTESKLCDIERGSTEIMNNLDLAIILLSNIAILYHRLDEKERAYLLQILVKRIIVSVDGLIIGQDLHSPFTYLLKVYEGLQDSKRQLNRSEQVGLGVPFSSLK